ncbi:MAG TPA: alpha/beta hydrolase [Roseiflexaceae bacterium]|nr:alpha/beta hydrolase [Roseiflexaceae bacterium]
MATIDTPLGRTGFAPRAGRLARRIGRALAIFLAAVLALALSGASYESVAALGDAGRFPPPGRLVDVGGHRLHIQCAGAGSPTVVLEAGWGGWSLDWSTVQQDIAATTRVCAYDRAGMGWSEAGPLPRTPERVAGELHTLLANAGESGPYVLVGHSLGAKYVRLFATRYPAEVAGMVLVDGRHEHVDFSLTPEERASEDGTLDMLRRISEITGRLGIARAFGAPLISALVPDAARMPAETRALYALLGTRQRAIEAKISEVTERSASDDELRRATLGDLPLVAIMASESRKLGQVWDDAQQKQAALSSRGRLVIAQGSGHIVQWDQPAAVIEVVREVAAAASER